MMKNVILCVVILGLTGCNMFDGFGGDTSSLNVKRDKQCRVNIGQGALVDGDDDSRVVEKVEVTSDCEVSILFQQGVGDDAGTAIKQ